MVALFDDQITLVLSISPNDDIQPIVDYISNANLHESIAFNDALKQYTPNHDEYNSLIEKEIIQLGNSSIINLYNRGASDYLSIVCDIADRLGAKYIKQDRICDVELSIILAILANAWQRLSKEERKNFIDMLGLSSSLAKNIPSSLPITAVQSAVVSSGLASYIVTYIVANAVSKTLLGRNLPVDPNYTFAPAITSFADPIGRVITDIWNLLDLAGPAYRVTIPCAIHIALLRQRNLIDRCWACAAPVTRTDNFCPNCAADLSYDPLSSEDEE